MTEIAVFDPHLTVFHSIPQYTHYTGFHKISQDIITVYTGYYRISQDFYSLSQYRGKVGTLGHSPGNFNPLLLETLSSWELLSCWEI